MAHFLKGSSAAVMAATVLVAGYANGDDDDRGGRGGRGGGVGGQASSRGDGGSSRSLSQGDSGSSRSFSRPDSGSSRSFSRGDGGSSRSLSGQSQNRSYEAMRSNRGEGSSQLGRSYRSSQGEGERSTFGRPSSDAFRSGQFSNRPGAESQRNYDGQRGQQYQARRPSEDQVRDFLQMRGDSRGESQRQRTDVARREQFNRGDDGDRVRGDRDGRNLSERSREGDRNRDFDSDRDLNREGRRDFVNREGDRDYQRWRDSARGRGDDDDHRDWSGRWREGDRFTSANRIRESWRDRDRDDLPFHGRWWDDDNRWHGAHWNWWGHHAHRHNRPFYWWAWATAPRLTSWVTFGWNRPYYWDYGPGEYIYYDDGIVYVNGRWYAPGPVFYDRTVRIVEQAPNLTPDEAAELEWLPLGVFAIARDGARQSDVTVQLAVTKDGIIGGTAYDQRTGTAYPIEGSVEKQTQRAVWSYTNDRNRRIVMETSIYNLTQPESTGLVHYGPNDMQVMEIVRLEQPDANAATSATGELPAP